MKTTVLPNTNLDLLAVIKSRPEGKYVLVPIVGWLAGDDGAYDATAILPQHTDDTYVIGIFNRTTKTIMSDGYVYTDLDALKAARLKAKASRTRGRFASDRKYRSLEERS